MCSEENGKDKSDTVTEDLVKNVAMGVPDNPKSISLPDRLKQKLPAAKDKSKKFGLKLWAVLGVMATLGSSIALVQFLIPNQPQVQIVCNALPEAVMGDLLKQVANGKIKANEVRELACAMAGQAFVDDSNATGNRELAQKNRYENTVSALAQSPNDVTRRALVLIADASTRSDGLDLLASIAKTHEDWRRIANLAMPWDTRKTIFALENLVQLQPENVWAHVDLARLYQQDGNLKSAAQLAQMALNKARTPLDKEAALTQLGDIASAQNDLKGAQGYFQSSLSLLEDLVKTDADSINLMHRLSISNERLGDVSVATNDLSAAQKFYTSSHKIKLKLLQRDPDNASFLSGSAVTLSKLGDIAVDSRDIKRAIVLYSSGLIVRKKLVDNYPNNNDYKRKLAISYSQLARTAVLQGDMKSSRTFYQKALDGVTQLAKDDPNNVDYQADVILFNLKLGETERLQENLEKAQVHFEQAQSFAKNLTERSASDVYHQRLLALSYNRLGDLDKDRNALKSSRDNYGKAQKILEALTLNNPENADLQRGLGAQYERVGRLAFIENNIESAIYFYKKSLQINMKLAIADPTNAMHKQNLSIIYDKLGQCAFALANPKESRSYLQKSLDIMGELVEENPSNSGLLRGIAGTHYLLAQLQEDDAQYHWEQAYKILNRLDKFGRLRASDQKQLKIIRGRLGKLPDE